MCFGAIVLSTWFSKFNDVFRAALVLKPFSASPLQENVARITNWTSYRRNFHGGSSGLNGSGSERGSSGAGPRGPRAEADAALTDGLFLRSRNSLAILMGVANPIPWLFHNKIVLIPIT